MALGDGVSVRSEREAGVAKALVLLKRLLGMALRPEHLPARRSFRRERFDGADVAHLIYATRDMLDWKRVLEIQPNHVVALNNLATLLAEQPGKGDEAVRFADRAIELKGPQPGLLDTKGTALLYAGKSGEAAAILADAVSSRNPDPRYYLHLAAACDRLGESGRAREAFVRAERGELARQLLTDGDRRLLAELSKKYR